MPKYDFTWHSQDVAEEFGEYKEATGLLHRWSELSDVVYTYTRAQWSGYKEIEFPLSRTGFYIGLLYMFPKYTLREIKLNLHQLKLKKRYVYLWVRLCLGSVVIFQT